MCLFFAINLAPPAAPLLTYLALPRDRADASIACWKAWIEEHARAIIVIVAAVIGIVLVETGLAGFHS